MRSAIPLLIILALGHAGTSLAQGQLDEALKTYWRAGDSKQKQKAIKQVLSIEAPFSELYEKMKQGRPYSSSVKRGFVTVRQGELFPPHALVFIPDDYKPEKKYPTRVFLHGAVANADPDFLFHNVVDTTSEQFNNTQFIIIYPAGWFRTLWWSEEQYDNIHQLLSWVKGFYNVDENQVRLMGTSDGGTGSYYLASREITTWSCITPFIGSLSGVSNLCKCQVFMNNFVNKPFLIVNTGKDHIMKKEIQKPFLELFKEVNPRSPVILVDSSGHNTRWMSVLRDSINNFVDHHKRNPYPDEISWQTDNTTRYNRNHFLIIESISSLRHGSDLPDHNEILIQGRRELAYKRDSVSGIVQLKKEGNEVRVKTKNVKKYRLLLSPDHFDFSKPVVVYTNGKKSFEEPVSADAGILLKWNAIDNDRTMLFAAEIVVKVN